jgi:four helix bundle protein
MPDAKPRELCERTFLFACDIVRLCQQMGREQGVARQVAWQLLRAGTSVGANAAEAKSAFTRREFACKTALVLREAREIHYWLRLAQATALAPPAPLRPLLTEADELVAIYTTATKKAKAMDGRT